MRLLLPQPGGFEGFLDFGSAKAEHFDPGDFAIAEPVRAELGFLDSGIAPRHAAGKTAQSDDLVAAVEELVHLNGSRSLLQGGVTR